MSNDKAVEQLGVALGRVASYVSNICDQDLEQLDNWLIEALATVSAEQFNRQEAQR